MTRGFYWYSNPLLKRIMDRCNKYSTRFMPLTPSNPRIMDYFFHNPLLLYISEEDLYFIANIYVRYYSQSKDIMQRCPQMVKCPFWCADFFVMVARAAEAACTRSLCRNIAHYIAVTYRSLPEEPHHTTQQHTRQKKNRTSIRRLHIINLNYIPHTTRIRI